LGASPENMAIRVNLVRSCDSVLRLTQLLNTELIYTFSLIVGLFFNQ